MSAHHHDHVSSESSAFFGASAWLLAVVLTLIAIVVIVALLVWQPWDGGGTSGVSPERESPGINIDVDQGGQQQQPGR
ncbi:MAG TPA: hypothetical protein VNL15_05095 [Dehalococcoidia bacterium]|nr:hypothetical protein [Dehalococcoidia bacterium]